MDFEIPRTTRLIYACVFGWVLRVNLFGYKPVYIVPHKGEPPSINRLRENRTPKHGEYFIMDSTTELQIALERV